MIVLAVIIVLILFTASYVIYTTNITSITISIAGKDYLLPAQKIKSSSILFIYAVTVPIYCTLGSFDKIDDYYSFKENKSQIAGLIDDVKSNKKLLSLFEDKVQTNPHDNHAKHMLGKIYLSENNAEDSYKILQIAAKNEPKNEAIAESLLEAAFRIDGKLKLKNINLANKILKQHPHNKKILSILTMSLYNSENYSKSLKHANKLIKLLNNKSYEYMQLKKLIASIKTNIQVINKNNI